jgi:HEPN domain-containing protein
MKDPAGNAARWLRQAKYDLAQAERLLGDGVFSYAAFFSEQAAQKALKAFLISRGSRFVAIHSVGELARAAAEIDSRFVELVQSGLRLDRHYLVTRYPDALPAPAIPAESYTREDAEEAVAGARGIVEAAKAAVG